MIREAIFKIFSEYPKIRNEKFEDNEFAQWVRRDLPSLLKAEMAKFPNILWVASAGQGRWADAPWIAAFNPLVTETAQEGFYPVYLFSQSLDRVYLSLNQGMARLRKELGTQAKTILSNRASILRARVTPEYRRRFNADHIDLNPRSGQSRLAFYEPGHAFGKLYIRNKLPSEEDFAWDLAEMLSLYNFAIFRGGTQELETTGHAVAEQGEEYISKASLEEKRRLRLHFRIERNQKLARLAKQVHGYTCQICGFNFSETYGELGRNYIEAHHLTPLHDLPPDKTIRLSPKEDFTVLCANCHRMVHYPGAPISFDDFRNLFKWKKQ
ncbi:MrcB family domain-containing protein [Candidatus Latescibacterota bacterium]